MPRKPKLPPEILEERARRAKFVASNPGKIAERKFVSASISREIKIATMTALNMGDAVKYMYWLKHHRPSDFVQLVKACITKDDDDKDNSITLVVQQVHVDGPIPGVINSPIEAHISPPKLITNNGEVIDG